MIYLYFPNKRKKRFKCYVCGRYFDSNITEIYIDGQPRIICIWCYLPSLLYQTLQILLDEGDEKDISTAVRVLEGINDLVEDNPLIQGIRVVVDEWFHTHPKPLYLDELYGRWGYRLELDRIIQYLKDEDLFVVTNLGNSSRNILAPGKRLKKLLTKFPTSRALFRDVVKIVSALIVVKYLADPQTRKLRMIYATLQAIGTCIDNKEREPVVKAKGYRCDFCSEMFSTKIEARTHLQREHYYQLECTSNECIDSHIEIIGEDVIGEWCDYTTFIEKASTYGVGSLTKYLRYLLSRGVIIPIEGDEVVMEKDGKKFIAVDMSWIRLRERMRGLERDLTRGR